MNISDLITFIKGRINTKYLIKDSNNVIQDFLELDDHGLIKSVLRLTRNSEASNVGEKTILIVEIQNKEQLPFAIKWSAVVKDSLLDPETFDLYLLIIFNDDLLSIEETILVESSEHICKKYVQRETESPEELISRTFLTTNREEITDNNLNEPVRKSLLETSVKYDWLTEEKQTKWKEHFLSNATGIELVDLLIPEINNNHEIS